MIPCIWYPSISHLITAPGTPGANQPYHFAENLELPEAEMFLGNCFATSERLASAAVRELVGELRGRHYCVVGSAVLLASGRPLPPLSKILASHALIHAAEGEFFREAIWKACEGLDLAVTGFESATSTNVSGQRSAKRRLGCGNKFPPLAAVSDRPGPRIKKRRHSLR